MPLSAKNPIFERTQELNRKLEDIARAVETQPSAACQQDGVRR